MDHSPRFWALLERHCPGYREPRAGCAATAPRSCCERARAPRVGVVGHVEWVDFAVVDRLPRRARSSHARERFDARRPAAARSPPCSCARLAGAALLLTALGDDELGARAPSELRERTASSCTPRAARARSAARSRTSTPRGERTITVLGERLVPHGDDALPWERSPSSTAST